jgi:Tol biopolymer transport system component
MKTTKSKIRCGGMLSILVLALGLTAEVANADFTFGEPTNLGPTVNSSAWDVAPNISADGLELFFWSTRPGGSGKGDIWVATRATKNDDWGTPVNLGPTVNSSTWDVHTCVSADGLTLYFGSMRPGTSGHYDLWVTTRETKNDAWGPPVNLGPTVNSSVGEWGVSISADGLSLYFSSQRPGGYGGLDLWVTTRETTNDDWGPPVNLGPTVNSSASDGFPCISTDDRMLFFSDYHLGTSRPGGYGGTDIWMTTRATKSDPWGEPVNLGPTINSSSNEDTLNISADGSTLYFDSNRSGGWDLWQAPIEPVVDFNGDGIVDIDDLVILIEYWGTGEPLCDIGPMPWGDGIVDVADLEVLMSYWEQTVEDPTLVAHWKLDEAEGSIAYDSAAVNDGILNGGPLWQPAGGQVDGALAFDGTDDYVSTDFVLNPADGPFSVFAWIKEGAPGQVNISQTAGVNWLLADPANGKLMTELRTLGRGGNVPIVSETVITDGNWHRIGFVWDGSYRYLYVDRAEVAKVAKDTEPSMLESSDGGLYLGAGSTLESGSFFSGLIDDVRIYNRAITP